ncbi:hypothetical protein ACFXJ5_04065 [Streptomyces sp. NPDC059373]
MLAEGQSGVQWGLLRAPIARHGCTATPRAASYSHRFGIRLGRLAHLVEVRDQAGDAGEQLEAVLRAYALISHEHHGHHGTDLGVFLHRGDHVARAHQQLRDMIRDLLAKGAESGTLRNDVAPDELATYCLHALAAAGSLPSEAAVNRLVTVTLAGLHPRAEAVCPSSAEGEAAVREHHPRHHPHRRHGGA